MALKPKSATVEKPADELEPVAPASTVEADVLGDEPDYAPAVQGTAALGGVSGEISIRDLRIPWLAIAHGVGGLATDFNPGDLVLDKQYLLAHRREPVNVILLSFQKYWKEYISKEQWEANIRPRSFAAEHEVRTAGGTTAWLNGVGPTFSPAANISLLIEKPAAITSDAFGIEIDGRKFALARWGVDKKAYDRVGPEVLSKLAAELKPMHADISTRLKYGLWALSTDNEPTKNGKTQVTPRIRLLPARNTKDFVAAIDALFGQVGQG